MPAIKISALGQIHSDARAVPHLAPLLKAEMDNLKLVFRTAVS